MDKGLKQSWEDFLNPDTMRQRLISASLYLTGYEILRSSIVEPIRSFYCTGFDSTGDTIDPEYIHDVVNRKRGTLYSSLDWLKGHDVINDADVATFERVKKCRNVLAHELWQVLGANGLPTDFQQSFADMVSLMRKIDIWWISNVEIPTNPEYDHTSIDENEIVPASVISMQLLLDVALGDDERSRFYLEEIRRRTGSA